MAAITWANVVDHVSTLASVDVDQQTDLIAFVMSEVNVSAFDGEDGPKTKLARIYLAAHMASLPGAGSTAPAGPVISQSRGKLSQSFQGLPQSGGSNTYLLTQWGRRYWELLQSSRARYPRPAGRPGC